MAGNVDTGRTASVAIMEELIMSLIGALVGYALTGGTLDDEGMFEVLAPYAPQRQRAVRYVMSSGFSRPRFGPRHALRDFRAM